MFLTKWDPFETLSDLQNDVDRLFSRTMRERKEQGGLAAYDWSPAVDIHEDDKAYFFDAEVPGLEKDAVKVSIAEGNVLKIEGEKKQEKKEEKKNFHRVERFYGKFYRAFTLPENANPEEIDAQYKDGLLKIRVAKKAVQAPKAVEVRSS